MKLKKPNSEYEKLQGEGHEEYLFHCFGCGHDHRYTVQWGKNSNRTEPRWAFNGDMNKPTFAPSLLMRWKDWPSDGEAARILAGEKVEIKQNICHLFVTEGKIHYLADCTHEYAGKTVEMQEVV